MLWSYCDFNLLIYSEAIIPMLKQRLIHFKMYVKSVVLLFDLMLYLMHHYLKAVVYELLHSKFCEQYLFKN